MKRRFFAFILSSLILFVLWGCNSTPKDAPNTLKVTQADEKIIQEYLDTKTNDINAPSYGKMYSAFKVYGTDSNRIYLWMLKSEYLGQGKELTNGVSIPLVLYIESKEGKIEVKDHKYPKDGVEYGKSLEKLFPQNVRNEMSNSHNELISQLEKVIENRIKEEAEV